MWIRVALNIDSLHYNTSVGYSYVEGPDSEEYWFDQTAANAIEEDGSLTEMWDKLNVPLEWGDCGFFPAEKCAELHAWLKKRLSDDTNPVIKPVYDVMLDYACKAIANNTGISFDF